MACREPGLQTSCNREVHESGFNILSFSLSATAIATYIFPHVQCLLANGICYLCCCSDVRQAARLGLLLLIQAAQHLLRSFPGPDRVPLAAGLPLRLQLQQQSQRPLQMLSAVAVQGQKLVNTCQACSKNSYQT